MSNSDPIHILVVEDDPKIRLLLRKCFELEGFIVSEAEQGETVLQLLEQENIHLITLDLNLGREDGLSIARDIRAISEVPIIMLTGKGDMVDRVVGLEIGADDYIAKPFHVREVLARVRSVLRRSNKSQIDSNNVAPNDENIRCKFDNWIFDLEAMELRHEGDDQGQKLTSGEIRLLEVFVRNANRVLTRDQLMDQLQGHEYNAYDRSIDNQIARLRKKIETDPKNPKLIRTLRGVGYKFVADLEKF